MARRSRFRNAALIYNPMSGGQSPRRWAELNQAADLLRAYGMDCTLIPTTGPGTAQSIAAQEAKSGRDLIIACGGDGTVNEIINGIAHSGVPLALLPAGTANILAKNLRLPWNIVHAADHIPSGEVRKIALGKANDRYFICIAGAGADAEVIRSFNAYGASKARFGMLLGVIEGLRQLFTYPFPKFQVEIDGETFQAAEVVALRSREQSGPMHLTQHASLFNHDLEVVVFPARSRWYFLGAFFADLGGTLPRFPGVRYFTPRSARVTPLNDMAGGEVGYEVGFEVDGEWVAPVPVEFTIELDALDLVVPAGRLEDD